LLKGFTMLKQNAHARTVEMLDLVTTVGNDLKNELNKHLETLEKVSNEERRDE